MKVLCFFITVISSSVLAGERQEINKAMKMYGDEARTIMNDAEDALKKSIPEVEDYFNNPGKIKKPQEAFFGFGQRRVPEPVFNPSKSCQSCGSQSIESLRKPSPRKETPSSQEVIIFVSLEMSDQTLKQLAIEAEKTKVRLVIRGLLDNSFKTTMIRLQELKIPVDIDPTLFELFEVVRVPTFVRCKMSSEGAVKEGHDRLTGNIFLRDALEKFNRFGDLT